MIIDQNLSLCIIHSSYSYLGREFDWEEFNCVHFVRRVYLSVGIVFPKLIRSKMPPKEFHLTDEEFDEMPIGHSVFFRRKMSRLVNRPWTHVAIIVGKNELIHCTRNLGNGVVITSKPEFLDTYELSPIG